MAFALTVAGINKSLLLAEGSISISDELDSRNTCSFVLRDGGGAYRPADGATVVITEDGVTRFAGTIDDIKEINPAGTTALETSIACVDYNQIADRHLTARVYENQTLGAIVADIVAQDLAGEGITTNNVQAGPTIVKAIFNYCTAAEAFSELSQLTGYDWNINYSKDLHFFSRETNTAPFSLADTSDIYSVKVQRTRGQYRNRQYLRAGMDLTDARTDSFKGDGKTKAFVLNYPCGKVPTVKVNTVTKTIGIKGVDAGKDWYWNKGEKEIVQDDAATALVSTDVLDVLYQGLFPIIVQSQDDQEILSRANAEGGTGIYEAIESNENIDDGDLATDTASSLLRRFGKIPRIVTFDIDTPGLAAGQLITINLTKHNLSGQFLIESVRISDVGGVKLRYSVKALDGEALGGWISFFQKLAQSTRKFVIRENEVLMLLKAYTDVIVLQDTLTYATQAPLRLEVGGLFCTDAMQIAEIQQSGANTVSIGFDASAGGITNSLSLTFPFTVGGNANRVLIVGVGSQADGGDYHALGVTFNGVPLTLIDSGDYFDSEYPGMYEEHMSLWYLLAPDAGTHDVVVSYNPPPGPGSRGAAAIAVSLYGAAQQAPYASAKTLGDEASPITGDVTTHTDGAWLVDVFTGWASVTNATAGAGQTERNRQTDYQEVEMSTKPVAVAGATSMSWTWGDTYATGLIVAELTPATP